MTNPTITYAQFVAGALAGDVRALNLFSQGQKPQTTDPVEAEQWFAQITRLEGYRLVSRVSRTYFRNAEDVLVQEFEGFIHPVVQVWLAMAAEERIQHRALIPVPPVV